jgi:lipoprotein-releasing system ATP-binding protein
MPFMLQLDHITKHYMQGGRTVTALPPTSMHIAQGEIVALVGASGAGKSTLLHIAGLLLRPDSGELRIDGISCATLSDEKATRLRREKIGFIYQFHHLLPELTAVENVAVPLWLNGVAQKEAIRRAGVLLEEVGLSHRMTHMPSELSGGEQQRVAIARALVHQPAILLADEPTGNLDPATSTQIEQLIRDILRARQATALIVTHHLELAGRMDRMITLTAALD